MPLDEFLVNRNEHEDTQIQDSSDLNESDSEDLDHEDMEGTLVFSHIKRGIKGRFDR